MLWMGVACAHITWPQQQAAKGQLPTAQALLSPHVTSEHPTSRLVLKEVPLQQTNSRVHLITVE